MSAAKAMKTSKISHFLAGAHRDEVELRVRWGFGEFAELGGDGRVILIGTPIGVWATWFRVRTGLGLRGAENNMMRTLSVFGLTVGIALGHAAAQQSTDPNQQPGQPANQTPAPQPAPQPGYIYTAPRSPLGGVPASSPRPTTVQGTPAALPQVTPGVGVRSQNTPTRIIPIIPPPQSQPGIGMPMPQVPPNSIDNTRSDLVRRLRNDGYGRGYAIVGDQFGGGYSGVGGRNSGWVTPVVNLLDGTVRGVYNGNDFRLGFSLGNNFPTINYRSDYSYGKYPQRLYRSYYSAYEDWDRYRNQPCGYDNPYLIVGGDRSYVVDPRMTAPTDTAGVPVRELTPLEKAEISLKSGDSADAVKQLKLHLKDSPDDAGVERLLAMALIDDRKVDQGVAVLLHAYMKQPQLAGDPVEPRMLSGGELEHRRRFTQVMDYANRVKTGSSYFAAAALAQSEGRFDTAKKMLDRAIATGLDKKVAEEMRVAIANR